MIAVINTTGSDLSWMLRDAFAFFGHQCNICQLSKEGSLHPLLDTERLQCVVYIRANENDIPFHDCQAISIDPVSRCASSHVGYRMEFKKGAFVLENVSDLPLNAAYMMYDVKSMAFNILRLVNEKRDMCDANK